MLELRFSPDRIRSLAERYEAEQTPRERKLTDAMTIDIFPAYRSRGYLSKKEFLRVCEWKTPRSKPRCALNAPELVKEVSALAMQTRSERLRIQIWTLLSGVRWPTASVFLHFAFPDRYPVLDFRALWSFKTKEPSQYTFDFWNRYVGVCRETARQAGVTMRVLDEALWKYSDIYQRT